MVTDFCKPINLGEGPAIRQIMTVPEALELAQAIKQVLHQVRDWLSSSSAMPSIDV